MTSRRYTTPALDALAIAAGVNLEIEHDESNPAPFAVWSENPEDEDDFNIIGSGDTESEAIEAARETVRGWEAEARR